MLRGVAGGGGGSGLTIGSTTITGGATGRLLYDNAGTVGEAAGLATDGTNLTLGGTINLPAAGAVSWATRSSVSSFTDGNVRFLNNAGTGFGLLQLGGITSAFGALGRDGAGVKVIAADGTTGAFLSGVEQTAPAAPATNGYRIFAQDNGVGKTQLMVQFATGAAQQIAIEP